MVTVKIQCVCGQNYAFDVEPVNGEMPSAVSCPNCGADGTAAANDDISQQLTPAPPIAAAAMAMVATTTAATGGSHPGLRITRAQAGSQLAESSSASAATAAALNENDPARAKLVREAKAKIVQGESMEQVAAFLKVKGFNPADAMELAYGFYKERVSIVRSNGVKKMIVGLALMAVPLIVYFIFKSIGRFSIRRSIWAYIVGIAGGYMFVSGIIMIVAPKSEKGTVVKE
jgi:hypothetical protein